MDKLVQIDDYVFSSFDKGAVDLVRFSLQSIPVKAKTLDAVPVYRGTPSPYKISTMTVLCDLRSRIDLDLVYENITVFPKSPDLLNVRLFGRQIRGLVRSKIVLKKPSGKKQMFLNQVTVDIRVVEGIVSAKMFRDGKVQIAGCKREEDARVAMNILVANLNECAHFSLPGSCRMSIPTDIAATLHSVRDTVTEEQYRALLQVEKMKKYKPREIRSFDEHDFSYMRRAVETLGPVLCEGYFTVMINSDFDAQAPLDKVKLVEVLKSCGLHCRPSSSRYPGINAKYLTSVNCSKGCITELEKSRCAAAHKRGRIPGGCATVSILAFAQGKVIMTGARSVEQLNETYSFITNIFNSRYGAFGVTTI